MFFLNRKFDPVILFLKIPVHYRTQILTTFGKLNSVAWAFKADHDLALTNYLTHHAIPLHSNNIQALTSSYPLFAII